MRRRFAMAVGGCLAVAAAGTAQQMMTQQTAPLQPGPLYRSPFVVANQAAPVMAQATMVTANGQVQAVQYIPVQPVQSYALPAPTADGQTISAQPQQIPAAVPANNGTIQQYTMQPVPTVTSQYQPGAQVRPSTTQPPATSAPVVVSTPSTAVITNAPLATNSGGGCVVNSCNNSCKNNCNTGCGTSCGNRCGTSCNTGCNTGCNNGCRTGILNGNPCGLFNRDNCGTSACNNNCQNNGCNSCEQNCCGPCGPEGRIWASAEYLLWWTRGMGVPALVTSSPFGTPRDLAGVLGAPGTRTVFGDERLNDGTRSGFRLRVGGWLDDCQTCGIEASYFFLNESNDNFSGGGGILGRPFFNVVNARQDAQLVNFPGQDAQLINFPGVVSGTVTAESSNCFSGFDVNFRKNLKCDCCSRTDLLVGFRYLKLEDDLTIREDLLVTDQTGNLQPGTRFQLFDTFSTRNEFYGPQFGLTGEMRRGATFVNWRGLIAFGTTHKDVTIAGGTTITPPNGVPAVYQGGLLALPTNIGRYSKNDFSVVPELNLNVGYQVSENFRAFVGYSFIYWSNVTRAGDVIDPVINPTQLPPGTLVGPARPAFAWNDSDFWAHGVSFGAELRY